MHSQTLYVRLTVAAPLHIGCAEVYEPTSFFIDQQLNELVHFEISHFLELLDSEALTRFSTICRKGTPSSLIELMRFVRDQAKDIRIEGDRIPIAKALTAHYGQTLGLPLHDKKKVNQELNQFQIMRTAFDPLTGSVYIPGSSIKGAIRTAVLNHRHNLHSLPRKRYEKMKFYQLRDAERKLQSAIVGGSFDSDPFRLVKVSDFFPVGKAKRRILYAVDRKKKPSRFEASAPYQIVEVVEQGTEFIGTITVLTEAGCRQVKQPVSPDEIASSLREFYGKEKEREDRELKTIGCNLTSFEIDSKRFPLRVGRHSGAECVTIDGHRLIKVSPPGKKTVRYEDHATTIWLASESKKSTNVAGLRPFGWVVLERIDSALWEDLKVQILEERSQFEGQQQAKIKTLEEKQEAIQVKQAEEERKLDEECRAKADPAVQRHEKFKQFVQALPQPAELPGQTAHILEQIKGFEDIELRRICLLEIKNRFKRSIKKGKKKAWAKAIMELCESEGI